MSRYLGHALPPDAQKAYDEEVACLEANVDRPDIPSTSYDRIREDVCRRFKLDLHTYLIYPPREFPRHG